MSNRNSWAFTRILVSAQPFCLTSQRQNLTQNYFVPYTVGKSEQKTHLRFQHTFRIYGKMLVIYTVFKKECFAIP